MNSVDVDDLWGWGISRYESSAGATDVGLLGRTVELATINECVNRLAVGSGGTLLIEGVAGIGKSALLAEVQRQATAREIPTIRGHKRPSSVIGPSARFSMPTESTLTTKAAPFLRLSNASGRCGGQLETGTLKAK